MNTSLFELLSSYHPMRDALKETLKNKLILLSLPKGHLLLEAPRIADHVYFLKTGFAVSFTFEKGKKQIENFWPTHSIILPAVSLFEQSPSYESIELLQQSDVLCLGRSDLMQLFDQHEESNAIYRMMVTRSGERNRQRIRDLQHLSSASRYEKLIAEYPRLEQIVPQEYIASYLGIAPQSLSRLKRNRI
jgi:CRP/FNR family transcriptional regulator, anaerobic regulatory protein